MIVVGAAMVPCPHMMYPALRPVAMAALEAVGYPGITHMRRLAVAPCIPVAGSLVGMLFVLGKRRGEGHHYNGDH